MKRKGLFFLAGISFLCVPVLPTRLASCQSFPLENKTYLRSEPAGITINGKKIRHRLGTGFDSNQNTVYLSVRFLTSHLFFFFFSFCKRAYSILSVALSSHLFCYRLCGYRLMAIFMWLMVVQIAERTTNVFNIFSAVKVCPYQGDPFTLCNIYVSAY